VTSGGRGCFRGILPGDTSGGGVVAGGRIHQF